MPFFAVSSGTSSGKVKHIPCSEAMVASNKRAALDTLVHHLAATPDSRILDGDFFVLGGSTDLKELAPGIRAGDISGIAAWRQPWWSRPFAFPPADIRYLTDWEEKLERMAGRSLERRIRGLSGAPGWQLLLLERLGSLRPESGGRVAGFWPHLELLIHGGVSFAPYRSRFEALLDGASTKLREVYAASEGFVAIADRGPGMGMRLVTDNGLFYEFVPLAELGSANPTRHWVGSIEPGWGLRPSGMIGTRGRVMPTASIVGEAGPPAARGWTATSPDAGRWRAERPRWRCARGRPPPSCRRRGWSLRRCC